MNYSTRIQNAQKQLQKISCDAFIIDNVTNLFYLTGQELSCGTIILLPEEAYLFVDSRYFQSASEYSPIPVILSHDNGVVKFLKEKKIQKLGFDKEHTTYGTFQQWSEGAKELIPTKDLVKQLRSIKDTEEIVLLKEAASLGSEGYDYITTLLQEGITEKEIASELEIFWKKKGGKGIAFDPIIAFGANSSMPHYHVGDVPLKPGDTVLFDIGVTKNHYHSDMTRVLFFQNPNPEIKTVYSVVLEAQLAALEQCRPGNPIGQLDQTARGIIGKAGYGDKFTHGLGHGVGLEVHEAPVVNNKPPHAEVILQPGMVITIEPGIYLEGIGGVRIEDTVLITEDGHENLTSRSKDLQII